MHNVAEGKYRIPRFQRTYVWRQKKVIELFDSIYKEYPIGSFFLWRADGEYKALFREVPGLDVPPIQDQDQVYFIIDGQQRITSLYVTLTGETVSGTDYGRICFDVEQEKFSHRKPDGKRHISVQSIWGPDALDLFEAVAPEHRDALKRCWKILQVYPISVVEVRGKDLRAVCDIFQRINQSGQRLDRFDLVSAMTFSPEFDLRTRFQDDIIEPLKQTGFGAIDPSIITQLLALLQFGQCTEQHEFALKGEHIRKHWDDVKESVPLAAATLRKSMGAMTADYLPYNAVFTLLSYCYANMDDRSLTAAQLEWVKKWFWRASFGQHYGGAAPSIMTRERPMFEKLAAGGIPELDVRVTLTTADLVKTRITWRSSAVRNAFLCLMAINGPRHLKNGEELDLVNGDISDFTKAEKHHIFPVAFLGGSTSSGADSHALPNFCFLPSELNKEVRDSEPAKYIPEYQKKNPDFEKTARSHLIPLGPDSGIAENDYVTFLKSRAELIMSEIARVCGGITAPRQEERQAAVEASEHRWRDLIHGVLAEQVGDGYWKQSVPQAVREGAEKRVQSDIRKHPQLAPELEDTRRKLDYLNPVDYATIVENGANWKFFQEIVRTKPDLQNHMNAFSEYRNCVVHGRSMTELVQMAGETALVWFETVLPEEANGDEADAEDDAEVTDDE